ncbi:segregation/condensation protein A [Balneolaceae bacterium ANBcel3]|nr:segregation/condensation protein A [Balneolaceae bacterium ANBcel3]
MYRVQLQNFEGPLDLLLFFIKKDELDIYDIPIAYITQQFLDYIRYLDELDLSVASEFIYMAGTLMAIKARMMIPEPEKEDDGEEEDDPRYELVQALLEYKRYKEVAADLREYDKKARRSYSRGFVIPDQVEAEQTGEALKDVTLIDLMAVFKKVMSTVKDVHYHDIKRYETDIESQSKHVRSYLFSHGKSSFSNICKGFSSKLYVVVTFLAILEMIKEQEVKLFVSESLTEFFIELHTPDELESMIS